jgi:hypothetical protein
MVLGELATITTIVLVLSIACAIVIYAMRKLKTPAEKPGKHEAESDLLDLPFKITKSVQSNDATHAKDELRILELEREILSDSIRRLYEAHAEGKISEQERERLASSYKSRMMSVKESMAKDETIVALHELEGMQEDLMKLFSDRFGELSSKVEELRSKINVKPLKEIPEKTPRPLISEEELETDQEEKKKPKKKRKQPEKPSPKTKAEKRIEEIRNEVEKVLDKLGQMEIES